MAENTEKEDERQLLGIIIADNAIIDRSHDMLERCRKRGITEESFSDKDCRTLYREMLNHAKNKPDFDLKTLYQYLDEKKIVLGGNADSSLAFLSKLVDNIVTTAHFEHYRNRVIDNAARRKILDVLTFFITQVKSRPHEEFVIQNETEFLANDLLNIFPQELPAVSNARVIEKAKDKLREQLLYGTGAMDGLSTGYPCLDNLLFGMKAGELIVLAARPSVGKTSLGMDIAMNVASAGHKVLVFSCEMTHEQLVKRQLASVGQLNMKKFRAPPDQALVVSVERQAALDRLEQAAQTVGALPIIVEDRGSRDVESLRSHALRYHRKENIELIVVDYMQLLKSRDTKSTNRQYEMAEISGVLKGIARDLRVPVIALSQLSRANEQRGDKEERPKLSDLRDSGAIEQDADVVMLLRRPLRIYGYEDCSLEERDIAYVDVAKNRNGETGEIALKFIGEYTHFENLTAEENQRLTKYRQDKRANSGKHRLASTLVPIA